MPARLTLVDVERVYASRTQLIGARRVVRAVRGVTLCVEDDEVLALVGESGSGKSTLGRMAAGLEEPTRGRVVIDGEDVARLGTRALKALRRKVQMVFQDPGSALDPRMTVGAQLAEPFQIHGEPTDGRIDPLLERVGLDPALASRLPHALSGGQKQRVVIARALALSPRVLVLDEPLSALDVSVAVQILELLGSLRRELCVSMLFISHDLAAVRYFATRVAVMYQGRIVEEGAARDLFERPAHPYARVLAEASAGIDSPHRGGGADPEEGCAFRPRCSVFQAAPSALRARCEAQVPILLPTPRGAQRVACHAVEDACTAPQDRVT